MCSLKWDPNDHQRLLTSDVCKGCSSFCYHSSAALLSTTQLQWCVNRKFVFANWQEVLVTMSLFGETHKDHEQDIFIYWRHGCSHTSSILYLFFQTFTCDIFCLQPQHLSSARNVRVGSLLSSSVSRGQGERVGGTEWWNALNGSAQNTREEPTDLSERDKDKGRKGLFKTQSGQA